MMKFLTASVAGLLLMAGAAQADVQICNANSTGMSIAMAARVDRPYPSWEARGWFNLSPGQCATPFSGDYSGENVYYFGLFTDGRTWQESGDTYPVCVPTNGQSFVRRGTTDYLQNCPGGWVRVNFYGDYSNSRNRRIILRGG
jgi:uncharacterized membrane protein